jgi:hypothetical protein
MRLLILGYSSIVQRRVLPAAAKTAAIDEISIASKSRPQPNGGWPKPGRFFCRLRHRLARKWRGYRLPFAAERDA